MKTLACCLILLTTTLAHAGRTEPGVKCRLELDRTVLPANQESPAVVKVTLDAPPPPKQSERPPVNLCIVLDRSGSMSGRKMEKAKEAAVEALQRLGSQDLFSMVIYDHEVETIVPAQSAANTEHIIPRIRKISSRGNTALFGGVSQGASEIRKNLEGSYVHRLVLISDGLANVGPSSPEELGRLGASLVKENISVSTIGLGQGFNEDLMTTLAERSNGNTYFVESVKDLAQIFSSELGDVLSVVAKKVIVEIECEEGVTPVRLIGRDGRFTKNRVEVYLNQLYGGQERYALLEVKVPAANAKSQRPLARARIHYEDLNAQAIELQTAMVNVGFSEDPKAWEAGQNKTVQKIVAVNQAAEAKDEAIILYEQGKKVEALQVLRMNADNLSQIDDEEAQQEAIALENDAQELEQKGLYNTLRKKFKTDSYQKRSQQKSSTSQ